jgi:hypothetical protein
MAWTGDDVFYFKDPQQQADGTQDGWYFWDRAGLETYGPYDTERHAEEALRDYENNSETEE